jgi:HEAT repeat protein
VPEIDLVGARVDLRSALGRRPADWSRIQAVLRARPDALDDELLETLLERFEEGPQARGVVEAFSEARHPRLFAELLAVAEREGTSRPLGRMALEALGALPALDAGPAVAALSRNLAGDPQQDAPWLIAVARVGGAQALDALVLYIARSDHPERMPQSAMQGLHVEDPQQASEVLTAALRNATSDAQRAALALLVGTLRSPGMEPVLGEMLAGTEDGALRAAAARALADQRTPAAVDLLVRVGRGETAGAPQARAALHQMRGGDTLDPEAVQRLRDLLREERPPPNAILLQGIAMGVLAAHGDLTALPLVAERVAAEDDAVAAQAIQALGAYGRAARGDVARMVQRYASAEPPLRASIIQSLGRIGGGEAIEALRAWSESSATPTTLRNPLLHALRQARTVGAGS